VRIRRVELPEAVPCELCGGSRKLVVQVTYKAGNTYPFCIPCARRIGVAAVGGRWGTR
jgi:hypothetical protein